MIDKSTAKASVPGWITGAGLITGLILAYMSKSPRMLEEVQSVLKEFSPSRTLETIPAPTLVECPKHEIVILGLNGKPFGGQPS